jgi:hypothetical protein
MKNLKIISPWGERRGRPIILRASRQKYRRDKILSPVARKKRFFARRFRGELMRRLWTLVFEKFTPIYRVSINLPLACGAAPVQLYKCN